MPFDRRTLLKTAGVTLAAGSVACPEDRAKDPVAPPPPTTKRDPDEGPKRPLAPAVLDTLTAVAERILPSDASGPGAREANVGAYLAKTLDDPRMKNLVPLMNRAAGFLVRYAQTEHQTARFVDLPDEQKDDILTRLAEGRARPDRFSGPGFMQVMIALTLEGFLGDPRHGGNKDRVAWAWLGYDDAKGRAGVFAGGGG